MRITDIHVEGFGVWNDLKLGGISPQITAFYGANEAGKTTLMQFLRSVLYGVSPLRRSRYLPPLNGGRPGGVLRIEEAGQHLAVSRIADRGPEDLGLVTITDETGHASGDRPLRDALAGIDERTYEHIFALGLGEIQQLGTLTDSQAAEWLYRLTSGLDRVSLYDVIQGIRSTRRELLSDNKDDSRIVQLLSRREELRGEINQLAQQNRRWSQLAIQIEELDAAIALEEEKVAELEHRSRTIEIAVGLRENWRKRNKLTTQFEQYHGAIQLPADAAERLDTLNRKLEEHTREADVLSGQRRQLREESQKLGINERLLKAGCRIDALGEQRDWLTSLDRQIEDLEGESEELQTRLSKEQERLAAALGVSRPGHLQEITTAEFEGLHPLLEDIQIAQRKVQQAEKELDQFAENERSLKVRIDSAIVGGEHHGLPMDLEEASDLVAHLRRRLKVEQRLDQTRNHEIDLEHQSHELLEDQVMPLWLFGWTLAAVVLGSLLVGLWLWVPNNPLGSHGSLIALGGLASTVFMFIFKFFTEDAAADKLEACQRQMDQLARQAEEIEREKQTLDAELPMTDGSVVLRLQAAEKHLAELESVLPVEAQRKRAGHEVSTAESRLAQAQKQLEKALADWRTKLAGLGFSEKLEPERFVAMTERFSALADMEERVKLRQEEIVARQREHAALTRRIMDLASEVDCVLESQETEVDEEGEEYEVEVTAFEQLEHLLEERRRQLADVDRRKALRQRAQELKQQEGEHRRTIVGVRRRRSALFQAADCEDETAYRQLIDEQKQVAQLRTQLEQLNREIRAAIGNQAPEETFATMLSPENIQQLDASWEELTTELGVLQLELKDLVDRRGALRQEQRRLVEDRSLAERQLELNCLEQQLTEARQEWREHAMVSRVLERVRHHYEANRQPATLALASQYMSQLTGGEYQRIWTPIADDILLVENSDGHSLTVDKLSRGTREQLFLSIRLAVVATFAQRGVRLPMVLDDVLVNFDAVRARRAAEVLQQFSADGHQVLLFTCHEHMWQMFRDVGVDCRRLPSRSGDLIVEADPVLEEVVVEAEPVVEEIAEPEPVPRPKKKRKPRRVVVQEIVAPDPVDFYDYPFVERIEEEVITTPVATVPEEPVSEYTVPVAETTYEWMLDEEELANYGTLRDRLFRDHLEPRTA